ncbi:PA2169 family four-helix-bundle protein [Sphingosinicella sp. YJ22]|uniref:PA2169 family four-helix-bundle protein n=1 Tax=Sphingosinicella sp. YJ22 TaxID=1104780 RepID=UPI00140C9A42|nr:PA2169 family four-helix-bundle protein [Sphingosinicella sp. YJ22]
MSTNTDISKLDDLIHTVIDSIKGFENSAEGSPDGRFASFFRDMAQERREVVTTLQAHSRALGGTPTEQGSVAGTLHRRWEDLRAALGGSSDKAVIQEVERGEDYLKEEFERAMNDTNVSEETRAVMRSCYESVRRGHDTARDLKHQLEAAM